MAELTAAHFADLCREGPVRAQIETIEASRKGALLKFWLTMLGGTVLAVALAFAGYAAVGPAGAWIALLFGLIATLALAFRPVTAASAAIKHPTLESLAPHCAMTFEPGDFDPPVFGDAQQPLFGSWLSGATFTDLFDGRDGDGRRFAFYEATLSRGHGKHRRQVFSGQVYAFERRRTQSGEIVAVPDRGLFNFFRPAGGFERVRIESDPEFEKKFEIYATQPTEAAMMFGSTALRALLLRLRESGRIFVYAGPAHALVAVTAKNRFEPGSMFRAKSGEERVRLMFDDVCASLSILDELKATLG